MTGGPLVQVALLVCGATGVLVMWDERKHEAALVWAAIWTACCWLLAPPGWARGAMLALTALALLITTRAIRRGRGERRAAQRVERERELELLLEKAGREQWTTIQTVPARLRAYAHAARLLAAHDLDRPLPPPPAEPRPGPEELWRALDDAHRIAIATGIAADARLTTSDAVRKALRRVHAAADELAGALERHRGASGGSVALARSENPRLPTHGETA